MNQQHLLNKGRAKPTIGELRKAVELTKGEGFSSTDCHTTDEAAERVRFYLPEEFHHVGLSTVRRWVLNLGRQGEEPKAKGTVDTVPDSLINKLVKASVTNRTYEKSHLYVQIHSSDLFAQRRRERHEATGGRCQLCNQAKPNLELHVLAYTEDWDHPYNLMLLCADVCHPVADELRRRGLQ